jgi:AcrR family transcriptional regulator
MTTSRPYHHGQLRAAVIAGAVAEVEAVGTAGVSMREIARRAGVSHSAPAHHFGDKAGIFTAIATEGFRLAADAIESAAMSGPFGFLDGGAAYVAFALTHPGHFEVMFRPALHNSEDQELTEARQRAFAILDASAVALAQEWDLPDPAAIVVTGWSLSHGLATLLLTGNLGDRLPPDPAHITAQLRSGLVALGQVSTRHAPRPATPQII